MTRKEQQRRWVAMTAFRAAIKGWAFTDATRLPGLIRRGNEEVAKLPPDMQDEAREMMAAIKPPESKMLGMSRAREIF